MENGKLVAVVGVGSVNPHAWNALELYQNWRKGDSPKSQDFKRENGIAIKISPAPTKPKSLPRHSRYRRASQISRFMLSAALEALGDEHARSWQAGRLRIGISSHIMNGAVRYTRKFYSEVLAGDTPPSPILFPETVFNAPSSHIGAFFGSKEENHTFLGDSAAFVQSLNHAVSSLLLDDEKDAWLLLVGEELDWPSAEAPNFFAKDVTVSEGACAFLLQKVAADSQTNLPIIETISRRIGAVSTDLSKVAQVMRSDLIAHLPKNDKNLRLFLGNYAKNFSEKKVKTIEENLWCDWQGEIKRDTDFLGEGLGLNLANQLLLACLSLRDEKENIKHALVCELNGGDISASGVALRLLKSSAG